MRRRFSAAVLAILLAASPALAHDTWLLPRQRGAAKPGAPLRLDLTSGMAFPKLEHAIKPDRVARATMRLGGTETALGAPASDAASLVFTAAPDRPGVAVFAVELHPRDLEIEEENVRHYLDEIGASDDLRKTWASMPAPRKWTERYRKLSKSIVVVGSAAGDASAATPAGLDLEIVPVSDVASLRAGSDSVFVVTRRGKPFAGFPVAAARAGRRKLLRTDAEGRLTFRPDRAGTWLLAGTDLRKSADASVGWESEFATLTVEVGEARP